MTEYIERDKALANVISTGLCDAQGNMYGAGDVVLADDIKAVPAADVTQVVYGKWINAHINGVRHLRCSSCGEYTELMWHANFDYKYCPNCGAKMGIK